MRVTFLVLGAAVAAALAGCSGGSSGKTAPAAAAGGSGANGAAASVTPARIEDVVATRIVVHGTGFTAPAYVELRSGIMTEIIPALSVTPTEVEAIVRAPGVGAGQYELRVGAGVPSTASLFAPVPGPALTLPIVAIAPAGGPGRLRYPRFAHEAVKLPSGNVLIVGGAEQGLAALAPIESYDPATDTFSFAALLREPRVGHRAVLLDSGRVLVAGGLAAPRNAVGAPPAGLAAEVFDPALGFSRALPLTIDTKGFSLTPMGGDQALLAGGTDLAGAPLANAFVIDASNGNATAVPAPGPARRNHAAVRLPSGDVAIFGGEDAAGVPLETGEVFDPKTGTWQAIPGHMSAPRGAGVKAFVTPNAAGTGFEVAIAGGASAAGTAFSETWTPGAGFAAGAIGDNFAGEFAADVLHDRAIVAAGARPTPLASDVIVDTRGAQTLMSLQIARDAFTLTAFDADHALVAGGVASGGTAVADSEVISLPGSLPRGTTSSAITTPGSPVVYSEDLPAPIAGIAYVLDISGSMDWDPQPYTDLNGNPATGSKLERAKTEIARSIRGLAQGYWLEAYTFDCDVYVWQPAAVPVDPAAQASAEAWIMAAAAQGATGTGPAVARALADKNVRTVILFTDGAPDCIGTATGSIADHQLMIQQANTQGATIHCVGYAAYGVFDQFLQDVSSQTGGKYLTQP